MAIKALIYGGVKITSISPPHPRAIYDGVTVEFNGMTFSGGVWKNASITLDMSPVDALDLASELIKAADKHGEETQSRVRCLVKRLAKRPRMQRMVRGGRRKMKVACMLEQDTYKPGDLPPEGYLAWHEWAEVQRKAGIKQKQCGKCGLWRTPQELSGQTAEYTGRTRSGQEVRMVGVVCNACADLPPNAKVSGAGTASA